MILGYDCQSGDNEGLCSDIPGGAWGEGEENGIPTLWELWRFVCLA